MTVYDRKSCEHLFGSGFQPINVMPSSLEQKLRLDENRVVQEFAERCFEPQATRYAFAQYTRTGEPLFDDYLSTVVAGTWKGVDPERAHLIVGYRPEPDTMPEYASTRVAIGVCGGNSRWIFTSNHGLKFYEQQTLEHVHEALTFGTMFMQQYVDIEKIYNSTLVSSECSRGTS